MKKIESFYSLKDSSGITNREKIEKYQKVIRRVKTTDRSKSYEDSENRSDGLVVEDGKLIGFGIHIFNEDIYPLQSFEIYLRNCHLVGELDLSGQEDLLFVDIYHNSISHVDIAGDRSLRILGLQDNQIKELNVSDLVVCQGIDAGNNELKQIDVSANHNLVELYVNDNQISEVDISDCPYLKYFYCQNNQISFLDTQGNRLLRHLNATGNPLQHIMALAPGREEKIPLELTASSGGYVGLKYNPIYDAQWKETGEWEQSYHAYPKEGYRLEGWYDEGGNIVSEQDMWNDPSGTGRRLTARFIRGNRQEDNFC